ncbi:hypothetical protein MNEG_2879, partial [Monoraphidium neglectum]
MQTQASTSVEPPTSPAVPPPLPQLLQHLLAEAPVRGAVRREPLVPWAVRQLGLSSERELERIWEKPLLRQRLNTLLRGLK